MAKPTLEPTPDQTFELRGDGPYDFSRVLALSRERQEAGRVEEACNERFLACQRIEELLPDDGEVILEWNHRNSRAALELIRASAIDHFLIGDFELSAAMLELLLELDPEMRVVILTGYSSIATAVEAIKRGACNYLCKPADADDVMAALLSQHADLDSLVPDNPMSVDRLQWEHIQRVLGEHEGNISATARALGMHRRTLQRKLQKRPVRR